MAADLRVGEDEGLVGVVVSDTLSRGDERGYGLVITRGKICGAKKPDALPDFGVYLGSGSSPPDSVKKDAHSVAGRIVAAKDLEIPVSSIGQALFRKPSLFFGGYAIIKTSDRAIRLDMSVLYVNPGIAEISRVMEDSLSAVLGWRL